MDPSFRFRLKFVLANAGSIKGENNQYEFDFPEGKRAKIKALDAEKCIDARVFHIICGNFPTEESAKMYGTIVRASVCLYALNYKIGIDLGKNTINCWIAPEIKENISSQGIRVIDDVHGLSVLTDAPTTWFTTSDIKISTEGVDCGPKDISFFSNEICKLINKNPNFSPKIKLAADLFLSSFFEASSRAKFLTLVIAVETALTLDHRCKEASKIVTQLINIVETSNLSHKEINSIKGSLRWLHKDSISEGLRKLANNHLKEKQYHGMTACKFISKCYEIRSRLMHTGSMEDTIIDVFTANLELFVRDLICSMREREESCVDPSPEG